MLRWAHAQQAEWVRLTGCLFRRPSASWFSGSRPRYRPMPNIATISASSGCMGGIPALPQCKAKGDHHAREVLRLDNNGGHGCGHWHFGVHRRDVGSGPGGFCHRASPGAKNALGRTGPPGIWTDEFDTPLQRPAQYADQEFFTEAQREELVDSTTQRIIE